MNEIGNSQKPTPANAPLPHFPGIVLTASQRRLRTLVLILAVVGIFISLGLLVAKVQNQNPRTIPPPRPPVPARNGFDVLKVVGDQIEGSAEIVSAVDTETTRIPHLLTYSQKRALVAPNQALLETACAAVSLPYYELMTETTYSQSNNHSSRMRILACLMVLAGDIARDEGRESLAVKYYLSAITLGRRLPHNTALQGLRTGLVCESSGRRGLWMQWEKMTPSNARRSLTTLESLQVDRHPFYKNYEEEKYFTQCKIIAEMDALQNTPRSYWDSAQKQRNARIAITLQSRRAIIKTLSDYMDKVIACAKVPYATKIQKPTRPDDTLFSELISPAFEPPLFKEAKAETADSLLRVTLALRLYRLETGEYPKHLSQLVTAKLLKSVPTDSFSQSSPLRYRCLTRNRFLLYSIGPDGDDDNGRGVAGMNPTIFVDRDPDEDSDGDLVVGWYPY